MKSQPMKKKVNVVGAAVAAVLAAGVAHSQPLLSLYAGPFVGSTSYDSTTLTQFPETVSTESSSTLSNAGVLAGLRLQPGPLFFGAEVDDSFSLKRDLGNGESNDSTWHGRALVGVTLGPLDVFAAGGFASTRLSYGTFHGHTLGAGAEFHFLPGLSGRLEFLNDHFNDRSFVDDLGYTDSAGWKQTMVRAAAVFRF
jgi:opacity protein-like surface antigen